MVKGLVRAGVLRVVQNPRSNTLLLPVKKPDDSYRLAHDLRALNEVVVDFSARARSPHFTCHTFHSHGFVWSLFQCSTQCGKSRFVWVHI